MLRPVTIDEIPRGIQIGSYHIDEEAPAFIIAEIGINHNGSLALAKRLVDQAAWAGADCAKFQMRHLDRLYRNGGDPNDLREDLGSQYVLNILSKSQLPPEDLFEIFSYCKQKGLLPLCTPWDMASVAALERYGVEAYKVASADLTNPELLEAIAATGKPMLVSTGMSTEQEIRETVALLKYLGARYLLLHCISTYPAPFKDVNLRYLDRLRDIGNGLVGYSGHERGYAITLAAVSRGAKVIEKHFTLDRTLEGNDHKVSLLPAEFRAMVEGIRQIEEAMGKGGARLLGQGERMNRETLAKSLVATRDIRAGAVISSGAVAVTSPGSGLQPNRRAQLIGRRAVRDIRAGDFFFETDLKGTGVQPRDYHFRRPWGIPVRYHDFAALSRLSNMDFLEFHLSFKDLEQDPARFVGQPHDLGLVVHSPDVFAGDHLLNLAAQDETARQRSVRELQRVVDITRALKPCFHRASCPLVVVSVGGFSQDRPLPAGERTMLYERVAACLEAIDAQGVEIVPQTLPPFPWYFGGQLYCNLFVDPEDTAAFCQDYGYRICLDISHSQLSSNHRGRSLREFVEQVGHSIAHLHLVDAAGVDGEGLQIGDGQVDFAELATQLERVAPRASFIPEIWQGHKNQGEGFWAALERLERWF